MLAGVRGHFNGTNIVLDENMELADGQRVYIFTADDIPAEQFGKNEDVDFSRFIGRGEKILHTDAHVSSQDRKRNIDLSQYVIPFERGENGAHIDAQDYVRELRKNDRV